MEIIIILLIMVWLSYHPIYILYGVIGMITIGVMAALTPRLLKAIGIGLPVGWIVYWYFYSKLYPAKLTKPQVIACYVGTILVLWLVQILLDLPKIREERMLKKELKEMRRRELHPAPVGFAPAKPAYRPAARSKPVPIGFQPPGKKRGSSITCAQKKINVPENAYVQNRARNRQDAYSRKRD